MHYANGTLGTEVDLARLVRPNISTAKYVMGCLNIFSREEIEAAGYDFHDMPLSFWTDDTIAVW
jgi:hypothetical protein